MIAENQPVVFYEIIDCFYQQFIKTKLEQFKECKDKEIHTKCLYWFTLNQELHPILINH